MDHRPFENWLLENKPLSASEKRQLQSHLRECPSCVALAEVDLALKSVRVAAPAAGFVDRFQGRLAARKQALRRRNTWGFVILIFGVLTLLLWTFWPVLAAAVRSPSGLFSFWFASLATVWTGLQAIFHAGAVLLKVMPDFIPLYLFPALFFIAVCLSLLWVFSLMKFTRIPQGA